MDDLLLMAFAKDELTLGRDNLIYGAKYSRMDQVKFFKGCLPQILFGSFPYHLQNLGFLIKCREISSPAMSDFTIFGYGNQLSRHDLDPSKRKEGEDRGTVPGSSGEVISFYKGTNPIN